MNVLLNHHHTRSTRRPAKQTPRLLANQVHGREGLRTMRSVCCIICLILPKGGAHACHMNVSLHTQEYDTRMYCKPHSGAHAQQSCATPTQYPLTTTHTNIGWNEDVAVDEPMKAVVGRITLQGRAKDVLTCACVGAKVCGLWYSPPRWYKHACARACVCVIKRACVGCYTSENCIDYLYY